MVRSCFLITSFDDSGRRMRIAASLKAALPPDFTVEMGDTQTGNYQVPDATIRKIADAEVIVAELTVTTPNVYYELGIAFSLEKVTLCISDQGVNTDFPFNIRTYQVKRYENEHELQIFIDSCFKDTDGLRSYATNPVMENAKDYFHLRHQFQDNLEAIVKSREHAADFTSFMSRGYTDNADVANALVKELRNDFNLTDKMLGPDHYILAISGAGSLGKSTFAKDIKKSLLESLSPIRSEVIQILPLDAYMMDRATRAAKEITGFDIKAHRLDNLRADLGKIKNGVPVTVHPYLHSTGKHDFENPITISKPKILILEGIHSFYYAENLDAKLFMYAPKPVAKEHKFLADCGSRGYTPYEAFNHSQQEYDEYEQHVLPYRKIADITVYVTEYWRYRFGDARGHFCEESERIRDLRRQLEEEIRKRDRP